MNKAVNIFLLAFYSFGSFCLPMGDFTMLVELPGMYRHCKATEDKDMTPIDFITDHLINIDGLFDKHNNGDEQKPHTPIPVQHRGQINFTFNALWELTLSPTTIANEKSQGSNDLNIPSEFFPKIFHPPIV